MKKLILLKDLLREITKTKGRFISLLCMIMLGIMVSVGMFISVPIMKNTAIEYMKDSNFFDYQILSNREFTDEDAEILKSIDSEENFIEKGYKVKVPLNDKNIIFEVNSFSENFNTPKVIKGNSIKNENEILLDNRLSDIFNIGDYVNFDSDELKNNDFKVVGFVNSIDYIFSDDYNVTSIEPFNSFAFINKNNFYQNYSFINIKNKEISKLIFDTNIYKEKLQEHQKVIENILNTLSEQKYDRQIKDYESLRNEFFENRENLLKQKNNLSMDSYEYKIIEKNLENIEAGINQLEIRKDFIQKPRYNLLTKYDSDIYSFYESADKLKIVAVIYSGFFFLIAILISLITVKRMIEENRIILGTLKSLGYSNLMISLKFVFYSGIACSIGIFVGMLIGHFLIVPLIFRAYSNTYVLPEYKLNFYYGIVFANILVSYIATSGVAYLSTRKLLKEKIVDLMRIKLSTTTSKVLIEKIKFFWNRLNFFGKIALRNIFRYKTRMIMTILGISGCTGILFLGISLWSSVNNIYDKQFNDITNYDLILIYDDYHNENLEKYLIESKDVKTFSSVYMDRTTVFMDDKEVKDINVVVSDDLDKVIKFYDVDSNKVDLSDDGILVTVKLAHILGANKLSNLSINTYGSINKYKVDNKVMNYIDNYIYMNTSYFKSVVGKVPKNNTKLIKFEKGIPDNFIENLRKMDGVIDVQTVGVLKSILKELSKSMNSVIWVMIVCSVFLAVVVLYNLTNINISERSRELSTIKVLGMYPIELTRYIYRETLILTVIGQIIGIIFGYLMYKYVAWEMPAQRAFIDVNTNMFAYFVSMCIIILITILMSFVIYFRLKKVDMVEALKAIE